MISEFGIVLPQKVVNLRRNIAEHLEELPGYANQCVVDLLAHTDILDARIAEYDRIIAKAARDDARSKRLMQLPGIGPITASARLGRVTKAGDSYLRSLLERRGYWKAVVAIAAKNARLAWAVLRFGEEFRLNPAAA